jgi:hypothetical protein
MGQERVSIPYKSKTVHLIFEEFDEEVNIDDITAIDYSNLHSEFLTISALYNRIGMWRAECESEYERSCLHRKIQEAEKGEYYRKKLTRQGSYANGSPKMIYPTKDEVDNAVILDEMIQNLHRKEIRLKKHYSYMDSLFWSIKSKEKKVEKLIEGVGLTPDDFEANIVEGKWNGILIKTTKNLIAGIK